MICRQCGTANPDDHNFCTSCGRLLRDVCPRCKFVVQPPANFCGRCGLALSPQAQFLWLQESPPVTLASFPPAALAADAPVSGQEAAPAPSTHLEQYVPRELLAKLQAAREGGAMIGERRVVTMLFCDVKGSTAAAETLDPEEWTEIINGAFEHMIGPVYHYEGIVARLMGDGILAFFGAPIAHEDDPRRAVLAGLEISTRIRMYGESVRRRWEIDISARVGINTGMVVVGAVGSDLRLEYTAMGDAINLAARMEQTAEPGTVQVAAATYRLVAPYFDVESLGAIEVKGKAEPVAAYRVLHRRAEPSSLAAAEESLGPLVGREQALETVVSALQELARGRGQILFLLGEAGLGKTRLVQEALHVAFPNRERLNTCLEAGAFSYESRQPYALLLRLWRRALGLSATDAPEETTARIVDAAATLEGEEASAFVQVLANLFGVADGVLAAPLEGEAFVARLASVMEGFWRRRAARAPVVLLLDDLQWADSASLEMLAQLLALTEQASLLFLCISRTERQAPAWQFRQRAATTYTHRYVEHVLQPLSPADSRALLALLLNGRRLDDSVERAILARAEGNPLFLEEVVRGLLQQDRLVEGADDAVRGSEEIGIPDSLQALLTARIDRLPELPRRLLQMAAVIGRVFAQDVLVAMAGGEALDDHLLVLQRAELIRETARLPEVEFSFRHALTHDVAYHGILLKQRRRWHLAAGAALEKLYPAQREELAPVLARHYLAAGDYEQSFSHLLLAASNALRLHAVADACAYYEQALSLVGERFAVPAEQLLDLFLQYGRALELSSRLADALDQYKRLETIARERQDARMELAALAAQGKLFAGANALHDDRQARELSLGALARAHELGDRVAEVRILWNLLNLERFGLNSTDKAIAYGEQALALLDDLDLPEERAYILNDLADVYAGIGDFARAIRISGEVAGLWRALHNENMLADNLNTESSWYILLGDFERAEALLEEATLLGERTGSLWSQAYTGHTYGWLHWMRGDIGAAIEFVSRSAQLAQQAGFTVGKVVADVILLLALVEAGAPQRALDRARALLTLGKQRFPQYIPWAVACLVEVLLALDEPQQASAALREAAPDAEGVLYYFDWNFRIAEAKVALAEGRPAAALALLDKAHRRYKDAGAYAVLPALLLHKARALRALERYRELDATLDEAAALEQVSQVRLVLWQLLWERAARAAEQGDEAAAAALLAEARVVVRQVAEDIWPADLQATFLARPDVDRLLNGTLSGAGSALAETA